MSHRVTLLNDTLHKSDPSLNQCESTQSHIDRWLLYHWL